MRRPSRIPSQPIRTRLAGSAAAALFLLAACAEPPTIPSPPPSAQPLAAVGPVTPPQEYSWTQGQLGVQMGSATGRVCFLTAVSGRFNGVTELVSVGVSGGKWYLGGGSQSTGVTARARCLAVNAYSSEVTVDNYWMGSPPHTETALLSGATCALTGIAGTFTSSANSAEVYYSPITKWTLRVTVPHNGHVIARARCVLDPSAGSISNQYWVSPNPPKYIANGTARGCFLAGIGGSFRGTNDWVWVTRQTDWYLMGSAFNSIRAWATCVP